MQPKEHANLLAIFFWVFAGLLSLFTIIWFAFAGFMGFAAFAISQENRSKADEGIFVFVFMLIVFGAFALLTLATAIVNIYAGIGLRKGKSWAKTLSVTAVILNFLSFFLMGIWAFPFALALGIYGLWFIFSDQGNFYFNQSGHQNNQMLMNPVVYSGQTYQYNNPHNHDWK